MRPAFRFRPRTPWRAFLAAGCGAFVFALAAFVQAEEDPRRGYDLPADLAERSLKLFSQQSGRSVIAAAEVVKEIRTNAVKGNLTAREALAQMLAHTGLVASQDNKNGAFAIRREEEAPGGQRAAPAADGGRTGVFFRQARLRLLAWKIFCHRSPCLP